MVAKWRYLVMALLVLAAPVQASEREAQATMQLVGHYYLSGAAEVGSELLLKESGRFEWFLAYGAMDHVAEGVWWRDGERLVLTPAAPPAPVFRMFDESDYRRTKPVVAGTWVAILGIAYVGPVADIEVRFESASGKVATAVSQPNGDATVKMAANDSWVRAGLRAAGREQSWQWFPITPARAKTRLAGFVLTNPESMQHAPFTALRLHTAPKGLVIEDGIPGLNGTYVRYR